jgi:alcohol dehydrogenase, propanol-preferring
MENLCDRPLFTGYSRDGGFATHTIADARYAFPLGEDGDDVSIAPPLCAGLIGWRSLVMAGNAERLGNDVLTKLRTGQIPGAPVLKPQADL